MHGTCVIAQYRYDEHGDLTEYRDALGHAYQYKYRDHLLVKKTDRRGLSFYFEYEGADAGAMCVRTWGDGGIHEVRLDYDLARKTTRVTRSLGHELTYVWNDDGLVVETTDQLGNVTYTPYDDVCNPTRVVDPLGHATSFAYDENGHLSEIAYPDGTEESRTYQGHDLVVAQNQNGGTWSWSYNENHQVTETSNAEAESTSYAYDGPNLVAITDPLANRSDLL